ncbi:Vitamin B12 import ATP-binding protein BtuD [bioreactor metagenome]|uniref:Vitamin B12 import ATP-binding protein BtuD n=1 Tax=bioreactor metagenome TaxID=1076179 RepID=A0A645AAM7_9ZZZZ
MIDVRDVTMTYPSGKGIFDVTFQVGEGQVLGYLGPNGAGKTTTIRCLLGFTKPNLGSCTIGGLDCVARAPQIQKTLGYIPGEIAFLDGMTGTDFLKFMAQMRGMKDLSKQKELIERFELDPRKEIKKFSKGMKQKLGIVTAFMHDPSVLILDEPTSGLDPLMQNRFIELVVEQKKAGKTILMSSHMFEEIERTCDEVIIIKDGTLVEKNDVGALKGSQRKAYIVKFRRPEDIALIVSQKFTVDQVFGNTAEIYVKGEEVGRLMKALSALDIEALDTKAQTLEEVFLNYYAAEGSA